MPELDFSLDTLKVGDSIRQFPDQISQVLHDIATLPIPSACSLCDNIVVSGMGGSALGGRILGSLERQTLRIPLVVSTEYHLPNFVNSKSLVVISSFSGNTEETLSSLQEARSRSAQIFITTSGGRLAELAETYHLPAYTFNPVHNPSGQPRLGLGYSIMSIIALLSRCQLVHPVHDINQLPAYLRSRQSPARMAELTRLARLLVGKIPVLISSEHLKGATHAVKNMLNENSKTFACLFDLPELNHHLLEGLAFPKTNTQNLSFLFFTSSKYHAELLRRYPVTQTIIKKQGLPFNILEVAGQSRLFEALDLVQSGSFIAYFLALLNGVDPGPIPWVDWYKDEIH